MNEQVGFSQSRWFDFLADALITIFVCLLTVNKLAPLFMNADVMMNSIMSLQKVTLFYWGQDRLLNVLPFVLSAVQNARANFYLCIILSNLCFCALIWVWAHGLASSLAHVDNRASFRRLTFLVTYLLFVLALRHDALFQIAVWHIEYTLSYALFIWLVLDLALKPVFGRLDYVRMLAFVFIGMGINNSLVLPACFAFCGFVWIGRRISMQLVIFLVAFLLSFKLWSVVSSHYPQSGVPYSAFYVSQIDEFSHTSARNLLAAVNVSRLCALIALAYGLKVLMFNLPERFKTDEIAKWEQVFELFALFSFGWFLIFSVNSWVRTNQFHFRYFAPIIFLGLAVLSIRFSQYFLLLKPKIQNGLSVVAMGALTLIFAAKFVPLEQYPVFERVAASAAANADGYAGDYWQVWPAVMRDLINGKPAVGFTFRSDGDQKPITRQFSIKYRPSDDLAVVCFATPQDACVGGVQARLPNYELSSTSALDGETSLLRLKRKAQ